MIIDIKDQNITSSSTLHQHNNYARIHHTCNHTRKSIYTRRRYLKNAGIYFCHIIYFQRKVNMWCTNPNTWSALLSIQNNKPKGNKEAKKRKKIPKLVYEYEQDSKKATKLKYVKNEKVLSIINLQFQILFQYYIISL